MVQDKKIKVFIIFLFFVFFINCLFNLNLFHEFSQGYSFEKNLRGEKSEFINLESTSVFEMGTSSFYLNYGVFRDISSNHKIRLKTDLSYDLFYRNINFRPYFYYEDNEEKILSVLKTGFNLSYHSFVDTRILEIGVGSYFNDNKVDEVLKSFNLEAAFIHKHFFENVALHQEIILNQRFFYNLEKAKDVYSLFHHFFISVRLSEEAGLVTGFYNNYNLNRIKENLYENDDLQDNFSIDYYNYYMSFSFLKYGFMIRPRVEASYVKKLPIITHRKRPEPSVILSIYSDYALSEKSWLWQECRWQYADIHRDISESWYFSIGVGYRIR